MRGVEDSDPRVNWLRDRVVRGLDIDLSLWTDAMDPDELSRDMVVKFLNAQLNDTAILFYTSEVDTVVPMHESYSPAQSVKEKSEEEEEQEKEKEEEQEQEEGSKGDENEDKNTTEDDGDDDHGDDDVPAAAEGSGPSREERAAKAITETQRTMVVRIAKLFVSFQHIPADANEIKSMYFLHETDAAIPVSRDPAETDRVMSAALEFGVLVGSGPAVPLKMLAGVITEVYIPLLTAMQESSSSALGGGADGGDHHHHHHHQQQQQQQQQDVQGAVDDHAHGHHQQAGGKPGKGNQAESFRHEFLSNMTKFASQIHNAVKQVDGKEMLQIPPIEITDAASAVEDADIVAQLEDALEDWTPCLASMLEQQLAKQPQGKGPLAEVEYWRDRNAALSTLYEQLQQDNVKKMVEVLELIDAQMLPGFRYQTQELTKYYMEAKDNVKFLTTLERHFKALSQGSLATVVETLPSMMNALRMVWIISRHYSTDDRMVPLMERIAHELVVKVSSAISIGTIFQITPDEAKKKIVEAKRVLDSWEETYFNVRKKIEDSGRDVRWEFDRKRLFDRTKYMSTRCQDLYTIAEVLDQFHNILGPELKAVTGDSAKVDEVIDRVVALVGPIQTVPFDVFDKRYQTSWEANMSRFRENVAQIDEMTKQFIDLSFQKLRSAEGAFDLLRKFKNIQTREVIKVQMMAKFSDILRRYSEEVDAVYKIFCEQRDDPPLSKNQPPTAGAIAWSRSLFQRIKKPVLRFQTMEELLKQKDGEAATRKYVSVAKTMRAYETAHMKRWMDNVDQVALTHLKANILHRESSAAKVIVNFHPDLTRLIRETRYLDRLGLAIPDTSLNVTLQEGKYHTYVEQLSEMLDGYHAVLDMLSPAEAMLLEQRTDGLRRVLDPGFGPLNWNSLGIPDFIATCNKAISDFRSLVSQVQKNAGMIAGVVDVLASADLIRAPVTSSSSSSASASASSPAIVAQNAITASVEEGNEGNANDGNDNQKDGDASNDKGGDSNGNANGDGNADGSDGGNEEGADAAAGAAGMTIAITGPDGKQVPATGSSADGADGASANGNGNASNNNNGSSNSNNDGASASAADASLAGSNVLDVQEVVDRIEKHRAMTAENLIHKYKSIGPLLGKTEELVTGTNTSRSPQLRSYYQYWEKKVFSALTKMLMRALIELMRLLGMRQGRKGRARRHRAQGFEPLFKIVASLSAPEVVVTPGLLELQRLLGKLIRAVVETTGGFVRWMDGTCLECAPQKVKNPETGDEETIVFTFLQDISANPRIVSAVMQLNGGVSRSLTQVNRYLDSWRKYDLLWRTADKTGVLDKFAQKKPTCVQFDSRLSFYARIARDVGAQPGSRDIDFVRVSLGPLIHAIRAESHAWLNGFGRLLNDSVRARLNNVRDRFDSLLNDMHEDPERSLDDLKFVLNVIERARAMSMETELEIADIKERYRTLGMYGIPVSDEERELEGSIEAQWKGILREARRVDRSLVGTKKQFTAVTIKQVHDFHKVVKKMRAEFEESGPGVPGVSMDDAVDLVKRFQGELTVLKKRRDELVLAEKLFDLPITGFPELVEVEQSLKGLSVIYDLYTEQKGAIEEWSGMLWSELDVSMLTSGVEAFLSKLRRLPKALRPLPAYKAVEDSLTGFRDSIPLFSDLKNDALRKRHWEKLMEVTGASFDMGSKTFTLEHIFKMELHRHADVIAEVTSGAMKELSIENGINAIAEVWRETRFSIAKYTKGGVDDRGYVLRGIDEITERLDDNMMNLQSMAASRFSSAFITEVRQWEKRLSLIGEVTEIWMVVQRKWMYLESIFVGSDDIRMQLPEEARRFDRLDKTWRKLMSDTAKNPNVQEACHSDGRLELLQNLGAQLELCQKSLSDYLETKRLAFPRFFFISDDELLSILGSSDPHAVQQHMIKLYENCQSLVFGTGHQANVIKGMISAESESFDMRSEVIADGAVEVWMTAVEQEMKRTLHTISKEAVFFYPKESRVDWIHKYLGMVTLLGSQIWWTWEVEDVFRKVRAGDKHAMKTLASKLLGQLDDLVMQVRSDLSANSRRKINTLIILDAHARDVVQRFVRDSILDEREFDWESQIRFYWDKANDDAVMRQCTGTFRYGYEYMGLNGRLVITPLTDRCYMTLTQALSVGLGGSPAGPAGTGKTETVKDLAKTLGLLCMVFNCGEGLDYKAMGRVFSGLVQCGAWGCFDEFNRIDAEVLSVVSAQIKTIQSALTSKLTRFLFEGREIPIDDKLGIFVTMNPGYAGRTELPDNLKALFRPVTMIVPDLELICENMLFSEGFSSSRVLAKKMTVLYKLAKEQLSKQHHYDFGLRALKAVLVMAGALMRGSEGLEEDVVLMRALRDMNLPKFVFDDVPLFLGLIGDLFPGLDCPRVRYPEFNDAVEAELEAAKLQVLPEQADKVVQLYETMLTRHTTMVVGPTGGGKSTVINTLAKAQTRLGLATKLFVINPKAQTVAELYGVLDPNTRDWTDGLLSSIFRDVNKPSDKNIRNYILYDGDVDAVWVENMNTVMDDNKLLTLANGERIYLAKHCAMLFEVGDLQYASPATVSRCGMVYVDPKNLGWKPYVWTWCNARASKTEADHLRALFERYIDPLVGFVLEGIVGEEITTPPRLVIPATQLGLVRQLCKLLAAMLGGAGSAPMPGAGGADGADAADVAALASSSTNDHVRAITDPQTLESVFIFCCAWSIGGWVVDADRGRFDEFLKRIADLAVIDTADIPCGPGQLPGALPTLHDYFFDIDALRWIPWSKQVAEFVPPPDRKFSKILVPTIDTVRYTWLLKTLAGCKESVLFVGETGTAKTVTVQNYLRSVTAGDKTVSLTMNFSSRTSSLDVQRTLEDNVDKVTKDIYAPPANKDLIVFLDDLNMPRVDIYGTQQPIALLKFLIERGGMYDRGRDLKWKTVQGVQYAAAMGPPGGGRNNVDPRFISLFSVFNVSFPSDESLNHIFECILQSHVTNFPDGARRVADKMTEATLELYRSVEEGLPPTPAKFHYIFNLRDLSRIFEGICQSTPDKFGRPEQMVRLWRNETLRILHDRLISEEDKQFVQEKVSALISRHWPEEAEHAFVEPLLFGDFLGAADEEEIRLYEDMGDHEAIRNTAEDMLERYNEKNKSMNLVMFKDALDHLTRIERIIRFPRGNALLVGVGGSGKQSLTRLAAFIAGYETFEIQLARGYGEVEFREDLKKLYAMLGAESKKVVFLFTDAHVADEGFLELINNMLTSGVVPALYAEDEKDSLNASVADEVRAAGLVDNKENCWNYFIDKCRDNLHIVLCMSPVGNTLRRRCRNFPGLVSNTVIDWFQPWPKDALHSVAEAFMEHEDLGGDNVRGLVVDHMVKVHLSVVDHCRLFEEQLRRANYVTPKNYLDYISNYKKLLAQNRKQFKANIVRLDSGLQKLTQAADEVDNMAVQLEESKVIVEAKSRSCDELLVQITDATAKAEKRKVFVNEQEAELTAQNEKIAVEREEAEQALEAALPVLEAAKEALKDLSRNDLVEVRSFAKPPMLVEKVGECVVILNGYKEHSWKTAKTFMAAPDFVQSLQEFNTASLTDKQIKLVKDYFKQLGSKFTPSELRVVSRAAAGLLKWVQAIVNYYGVYKTVQPKRQALATAEKQLAKSERDLDRVKSELAALHADLEELGRKFERSTQEQTELKERAEMLQRRMTAATKLISGLGTEKVRWGKDIQDLRERSVRLVGDCLLDASFLSYLGPFNYEFRKKLVYGLWQEDLRELDVPLSKPFRVEELLTSEVEISQWASESLPEDELSVQNGILTTQANRFALCIDPQMQAVNWIKRKETKNNLKVATFNDSDFLKHLELCVSYGQPFLFENVDEYIDPVIDSVLERNIHIVGNRRFIVLGDKEVDWDENFRLYMTTKLQNPHYSPEVFGKTAIINYTVTELGLGDQLLNVVVEHERPDLEEKRTTLIQEMSENKLLLKELEDTLLRELSNAEGLILDNAELIQVLEDTKTSAVEIAEKLVKSKQTAKEIDMVRSGYAPAAKRGAILFFVLAGLSSIESMYEFSLGSYLDVFRFSLRTSKRDPQSLQRRLDNIVHALTYNVYSYACTALFERHKLTLSLQLTLKVMQAEGKIRPEEVDFFVKGNVSVEKTKAACPWPWVPDRAWEDIQMLINVGALKAGAKNPDFTREVAEVQQMHKMQQEQAHQQIVDGGAGAGAGGDDNANAAAAIAAAGIDPAVLDIPELLAEDRPGPFANFLEELKSHEKEWHEWFDLDAPESVPLPGNYADTAGLDEFQICCVLRVFRPDRVFIAVENFVVNNMGQQYVEPPVVDYDKIFAQSTPTAPIVFVLSPGADPASNIAALAAKCGFGGNKLKQVSLGQGQGPVAAGHLEVGAQRGHWVLLQNAHLMTSWLKTLEKIIEKMEKPHPDFRLWLTTEPTRAFPLGILQRSLKVVTEPPNGLKLNMRGTFSKVTEEALDMSPHEAFRPLVYVLAFFHAVVQERRKYGKVGWNIAYDFNESDFRVSLNVLSTYLNKAHDNEDTNIPWGSLRYLIGEALYGGRVSDAWDRRVLTTYLDEYFGDFLFDEFQPFFFYRAHDGDDDYSVPPARSSRDDYVNKIESLNLNVSPEVFGLHSNAEIGYLTDATRLMWRNLIELQPRVTGTSSGMTREEFIARIAADLLAKIPASFDAQVVRKSMGVPTPTQIVLLQEIERFNNLADAMRNSLGELQKALRGEIGMSAMLDDLANSLFIGELPALWRRLAPDTEMNLGNWFLHFQRRHAQYRKWSSTGQLPRVVWLSGIHVPESLLTALVQTTSRRKHWALDRSSLIARVSKYQSEDEIEDRLKDGCYISGLYLEGASWDIERGCLANQRPKELYQELPIVEVVPTEVSKISTKNVFVAPVYVTQGRANAMGVGLVFEAHLSTDEHSSLWVLQGVAVTLNAIG